MPLAKSGRESTNDWEGGKNVEPKSRDNATIGEKMSGNHSDVHGIVGNRRYAGSRCGNRRGHRNNEEQLGPGADYTGRPSAGQGERVCH